jgi:hypothetical protein
MRIPRKDISHRNQRISSVKLADLMLKWLLSKSAVCMGGSTLNTSASSVANRPNTYVVTAIIIVSHAMQTMQKYNQHLVRV